jgi:hypothetical protein
VECRFQWILFQVLKVNGRLIKVGPVCPGLCQPGPRCVPGCEGKGAVRGVARSAFMAHIDGRHGFGGWRSCWITYKLPFGGSAACG